MTSWLDIKLGLRMLAKHPGLSVVGGLAMAVAVAIGAASPNSSIANEPLAPPLTVTVASPASWRIDCASIEVGAAVGQAGFGVGVGSAAQAPSTRAIAATTVAPGNDLLIGPSSRTGDGRS